MSLPKILFNRELYRGITTSLAVFPYLHNQKLSLVKMIVAPYSSDTFNTLPSLRDARELFKDRHGEDAVQHLLDLIEQQGMEQKFGVILLHRHFDLQKNEALVDTNGTSSSWSIDETLDATTFKKYNGEIIPHSWMFQDGGQLAPYEFAFSPTLSRDDDTPDFDMKDIQFLDEFSHLVQLLGMKDVFGLCSMRGRTQKTMEVTEGGANVTFPLKDDYEFKATDGGADVIPAMWGYFGGSTKDQPSDGLPVVRGCFQWCTGPYECHALNHVGSNPGG